MELPLFVVLLSCLGALTVARFSFFLIKYLYIFFLRPQKNLLNYGRWAVITGSTDGIGKALSFELASLGLNLILIGRNPDKLREVNDEIKSKFPSTTVQNVTIDLSRDLTDGVRKLEEAIHDVDVGVLLNCAGVSNLNTSFLHELEEDLLMTQLRVNLESLTATTAAVLPMMLRKKRGTIVNIGSGSTVAIPSHPLLAVYAGTKAYVDSFSRCLHAEYKSEGIHTQCQVPLYVATKMVAYRGSSFFAPIAEEYAKSAVRFIGYEPRCMTYWPHFLQWCLATLVPDFIINHFRLQHGLSRRKKS
ncbi:very-long-chain 3-oxoacyl-CoA reductase 1-like [Wolffia australiana]